MPMRTAEAKLAQATPMKGRIKYGSTKEGEIIRMIALERAVMKRRIPKTTDFILGGATWIAN